MFTVEMLPAYLGDSLWVEYGSPQKPNRFLIDGGLVGTVDRIKKKIHAVADAEGGTCRLELLVLSHVDADHIEGLIKLLGTKRPAARDRRHLVQRPAAPPSSRPPPRRTSSSAPSRVSSLAALDPGARSALEPGLWWQNDLRAPGRSGAAPRHRLPGAWSSCSCPRPSRSCSPCRRGGEQELEAAGLLHATHEELMAALAKERKLAPDDEFLGAEEIDVTELVGLRQGKDTSPANGSSIAFVGTFEGKRCLFSGDAYWDVLEASAARLAAEERTDRLELDSFKIPHHGSAQQRGRPAPGATGLPPLPDLDQW